MNEEEKIEYLNRKMKQLDHGRALSNQERKRAFIYSIYALVSTTVLFYLILR